MLCLILNCCVPCLAARRKVCAAGRLCNKQGAGECFWLCRLIFLSLKLSPSSRLTGNFSDNKVDFCKAAFIWLCIVLCWSVWADGWQCIEKNEEGPSYFTGVLSFGKVKCAFQCSTRLGVYPEELQNAKGMLLLQVPLGELSHLHVGIAVPAGWKLS